MKSPQGIFLVYYCDEFVDRDAEGNVVGLSTPEARLYCRGDYWYPRNLKVALKALLSPSCWPQVLLWWRMGGN